MPEFTWKKVLLFIVPVVIVMLLLAFLSELLLVSVNAFVQARVMEYRYTVGLPKILESPETNFVRELRTNVAAYGWPEQRRVVVNLGETEATVDFSFTVRLNHPLARTVASGDHGEYRRAMVENLFGGLIAGNSLLRDSDIQDPSVEIDPENRSMSVHYRAMRQIDPKATIFFMPSFLANWPWSSYERSRSSGRPQEAENFEVTVNYPGRKLFLVRPFPAENSEESLSFQTREVGQGTLIQIQTEWISSDTPGAAPAASRQQVLQRVGSLLNRTVAGRLLGAILEALPLLVFLVILWGWNNRLPASLLVLAEVLLALLSFHFVYYLSLAISNLMYNVDRFRNYIYEPLYQALQLPGPYIPEPLGNLGLAIAVMSVLIPALLLRRRRQWEDIREEEILLNDPFDPADRPPTRSRRSWPANLLIWFTYLVIGLSIAVPPIYSRFFLERNFLDAVRSDPSGHFLLFSFSVGLLGAFLVFLFDLLYQLLDGRPAPDWLIPVAFWVILLGNLIWSVESALKISENTLIFDREVGISVRTGWSWLVYTMAVGAPLVYAVIRLVYALARRAGWVPEMKRGADFWIIVLSIVFAFPMRLLYSSSAPAASYDAALVLAGQLDNLIKFIFLAGLVWFFREQGKEGPALNRLTLTVGLIAGVTMMHPASPGWLFIPVRFLLGYWLLSLYMRPAEYWTQELQPLYQRIFTNRPKFLEQILELSIDERTYRDLYKTKSEKVGKDEHKPGEFKKEMHAMREELELSNEKARVKGKPIRDVALTFGPHDTAWENGLHAARWAALFSLPWMAIWVYNFMTGEAVSSPYPLWSFISELLNLLIRWLGIAFFFGYFYPFLRGQNGLQKGVWLWLVFVAPALPLALIDNSTVTEWQGFLFWVLQVFIHCILLGLVAFDYLILRQGQRDWRMLFELHGIPSIGISISTILLAIGTAVTTLLQSRGEEIVTTALTFILPSLDTLRNTMP